MADHAKRSGGERQPRPLTRYSEQRKLVLRRPPEPKQYVSIRYTERLAGSTYTSNGIEPSVGSVGDSYDCEYIAAARRA
ncbi:hypothetical protein [Dankookia rubra]|uniref:hypothetical protein n=1 Tax=Dankookia rubra TaxID=1442381 RepID=UPI00140E262A|nr:hypothetical protein [Dankookia rubra]